MGLRLFDETRTRHSRLTTNLASEIRLLVKAKYTRPAHPRYVIADGDRQNPSPARTGGPAPIAGTRRVILNRYLVARIDPRTHIKLQHRFTPPGIKLLLVQSPHQDIEQIQTRSRTNDPVLGRSGLVERVRRTIHDHQSKVDNAGPCIQLTRQHVRVRKADARERVSRESFFDGKNIRRDRLCAPFAG
jgi:hypothetical protein